MVYRCIVEFIAQLSALGFHLISCKLGSIISDDTMRDTITVDYAGYKVNHWPCLSWFYRFGLYSLSEFIYHYQQVFLFVASPFKGSNHIKPPDREGPSNGDCS